MELPLSMCRAGVITNDFNVCQLGIMNKSTGMRNLLYFPAIHRIYQVKEEKKHLCGHRRLDIAPLSKAKWLRLYDYCRGLRIGAVKGCVTEVMH